MVKGISLESFASTAKEDLYVQGKIRTAISVTEYEFLVLNIQYLSDLKMATFTAGQSRENIKEVREGK